MKYYVGHLEVFHEEYPSRSSVCIAATEKAQAERLLAEAARTFGGCEATPDENGNYYSDAAPTRSVRPLCVSEVSAVTFQELSAWCRVLGEDRHALQQLAYDERAKALAHRVGQNLKRHDSAVAHGKLLHAVAASLGDTDWQVLVHGATRDVQRPALELYVDAETPAPPANVAWPLDKALWGPYVDKEDAVVTFTVMIPLKELVDGHDVIVRYCEEAFDRQVRLVSPEFRVVREALENDQFDGEFCGDVQLQVTCTLASHGD